MSRYKNGSVVLRFVGHERYSAPVACYSAALYTKKVALTACMRKLLVILNSILKYRSSWYGLTLKVTDNSA